MTATANIETALKTGKRLVELVNAGESRKAIEELYADNAEHHEATEEGEWGGVTTGKDAILESTDRWKDAHEIHSGNTDGPYPHQGRFI